MRLRARTRSWFGIFCNAVAGKIAADLPEALTERPAHRHPHRPRVLDGGDVLADLTAVLRRQALSQSRTGSAPSAAGPFQYQEVQSWANLDKLVRAV